MRFINKSHIQVLYKLQDTHVFTVQNIKAQGSDFIDRLIFIMFVFGFVC